MSYTRKVLGRIDTKGFVFGLDDANFEAVFEGAQLLEALRLLERADGEIRVSQQKVAAVAIEADVLVVHRVAATPNVGDGGTREVDSVLEAVGDNFDDIGIVDFAGIFDLLFERAHLDCGLVSQRHDGGIDCSGIDEGLIALDVDDDLGVGVARGDFGNPVGAGNVVGPGHPDGGSEAPGFGKDSLVVGGDNSAGEVSRHVHAFPDVFKHSSATKGGEGFTGKSGRSVPGWNHSQDSAGHTKVYHIRVKGSAGCSESSRFVCRRTRICCAEIV